MLTTAKCITPERLLMCRRLAAAFATLVVLSVPAGAMPQCGGRDLTAALQTTDQSLHRRIREEGRSLANTEANLWRIEREGAEPSYLFATVHVTDSRLAKLSPQTAEALATARSVAVEVTGVTEQSMSEALAALADRVVLPPTDGLGRHLSANEQVALSRAALAVGADSVLLDRMQPWFVGVMLALPPCEQQRLAGGLEPLDGRIEAEGIERGAEVVGLETIEEQLTALADMPFETQIANLKLTLALSDATEDLNETLITLYREHRIGEVWPLTVALAEDKALARRVVTEFQLRLIEERNIRMRDRALPLIERGGAFVAVGALHLPGDKGLVALFREAGYTVTPVE
ncbi:MAG: TraB/GumN family protein [Hyphomicrobiaceae bacterium]